MRTTITLPDPLLRQLKSRAALQGTTLKALVQSFVERGLNTPAETAHAPPRSVLPSLRARGPLPLQSPSNAGLFQLLDDA